MPEESVRWHFWRGSPELLAHVARTAVSTVAEHTGRVPACCIRVEVDGDEELFESPEHFRQDVTPEALRRFRTISIAVGDDELNAVSRFHWQRWWWQMGRGPDAEVSITVCGSEHDLVKAAFARLQTAVARGGSKSGPTTLLRVYTFTLSLGLYGAFGLVGALYLLNVDRGAIRDVGLTLFGLAIPTAFIFGTWLYLAIEIKPPGQTNLERTIRYPLALASTLIVGGVTKAIFG